MADPAFERACLEAHNKYRAEHGSPPLTINQTLTTTAIKWAQDLVKRNKMEHSTGHKFGENIYMGKGLKVTGDMPVKAWYDEIKDYSFKEAKFTMNTGHFTQVLWKDTKEVGVGIAQKGDLVYVVANYNPPGNVVGKFRENVLPKSAKAAAVADSKQKPTATPAAKTRPSTEPSGSKPTKTSIADSKPKLTATPAATTKPGIAPTESKTTPTPQKTKPSIQPSGSKPTPTAIADSKAKPSGSKLTPDTTPGKTTAKPSTAPSGNASQPKSTTKTYRGSAASPGAPIPTITVTSITPDMIKPPPAIKTIEIPAEQRKFHKECLEAHNKYRALHGAPALKLAEPLTQYATNWAQQLVQLKNVKASTSNSYGENIYMSVGMPVDGGTPVKLWYDQIKSYKFDTSAFVPKAGGFTQVVWKETQELGVGVAKKGEETYVVVSYNPRGNVMGKFKENVLAKR